MNLAAPLGLTALLLIGPLALWYVLKARRPRVEVSSTFLWREQGESVTAAVPWQRLRPDATFWLLLAAIVLLALALARPWRAVPPTLGEHTVVILDASASMLANENGPTRLEQARRQVGELIEGMGQGQTVSVIEAGDRARVITSAATDPRAVERALTNVRPGQGASDLSGAFTLAESVLQPEQPTLTYLFTDRELGALETSAAPQGLGVVPVGTGLGNVAVTQLQSTPTGTQTAQVFASVRNFGREPVQANVRVATADTELASKTVDIAGRESSEVVIDVNLTGSELIRGSVTAVAVAGSDAPSESAQQGDTPAVNALSIDDTAVTVASGTRDVTALVAGPGNIFVESALASVPGVTVTTAEVVPEQLTGVDLLIVDRVPAPATVTVPTMYLASTVLPEEIAVAPGVRTPAVTYQDPDHPLLAGVDLSNIAVSTARPALSADAQTVVGGPAGSLVLAGRVDSQPMIYVGFDLLATNLPLDVAWPVLVSNSVSWLAGALETPALRVGDSFRVDLPAGIDAAEVRSPSGAIRTIDGSQPLLRPDEVGVWTLAWQAADKVLESTAPAPVIGVNAIVEEGDLLAPAPEQAVPSLVGAGEAPPVGRRYVGPVLLVALLILLLADWLWAHRRDLRVPRPRWSRPKWTGRRVHQ